MTRLDGRMRKVERSMGRGNGSGPQVFSARNDDEADAIWAKHPDAHIFIGAWIKLPPRGFA